MSKVLVIRHVRCETLGTIAQALKAEGIAAEPILTFDGRPIPRETGEAAGLIIMGGPMGVYEQDRYPFLREEIRLIERGLKEEKPILGVCLGSQLLAAALGARVDKGKQKEIGWHQVKLTEFGRIDPLLNGLETSFTAFHWHGDVFSLPKDAASLASSALTQCQAFRYGPNAYGFLFHMEVTERILEDMVRTFGDERQEEGIDGREIVGKAKDYLPRLHDVGKSVFSTWAKSLRKKDKQ